MARHTDIDHAHAILDGVSWHIDGTGHNINKYGHRRDKRKCRYYLCISNTCALSHKPCTGSSKCKRYRK